MHVVYALGMLHRLLVPIRYMDGSATTSVIDMGSESNIIKFVGVIGGFRWLDVCSCQTFME